MRPSRRQLLGSLAASASALTLPAGAATPRPPDRRARRLLYVVLNGGLSHLESFDPKPELAKYAGRTPPAPARKPLDESADTGTARRPPGLLQPSPWPARPFGQDGVLISSLFPALGALIDRFWLFRSMNTPAHLHGAALRAIATGHDQPGHPALGAWIAHVMGPDNPDLPPFISLGAGVLERGHALTSAGFLPAHCAAASLDITRAASWEAARVSKPSLSAREAEARRDLQRALDESFARRVGLAAEDDLAILNERRRRLGTTAAHRLARAQNDRHAEAYGPTPFARNCHLACDLLERGARVVQVFHGADENGHMVFDCHDDVRAMAAPARAADRALATLFRDLERRGLLEETLLVITTEFGRSPVVRAGATGRWGRDHHAAAFTTLMAGSGLAGGRVWGSTDELGLQAASNVMAPSDLLANILTRFRIDPIDVTHRHRGRIYTAVDAGSTVIRDLRLSRGGDK